jgi:CRP-like cAMP-binding protein
MSLQTAAHEVAPVAMSIPRANRLLASLPEEDFQRLSPYLRHVSLRSRQSLLRQGEPVLEIVFPVAGACSLFKTTEDGHTIEILGVGSEGAIGATVALGQAESTADVVVLVPDGAALALPVEVFKGELQRRSALFTQMAEYCHVITMQLMQVGACNARHSAEERCSRWLLATMDRIQAESLPITQEMLAMALGLRRPTVTLIMNDLHRAGVVTYGRGTMTLVDRTGLLARACACYPALSPSVTEGPSCADIVGV